MERHGKGLRRCTTRREFPGSVSVILQIALEIIAANVPFLVLFRSNQMKAPILATEPWRGDRAPNSTRLPRCESMYFSHAVSRDGIGASVGGRRFRALLLDRSR